MPSLVSPPRQIVQVLALIRDEADRRILLLGLITAFVVVISGALAALSPLVLKSLVDSLAGSRQMQRSIDSNSVYLLGAQYLVLLLVGRALGDIRPLLSGAINQRLHSHLTRRFFDHVARLPIAYLHMRRSGELLHSLDLASAGAQMVVAHLATSLLPVLVELITMALVLVHLGQPALVAVFGAASLVYFAIFSVGSRRMTRRAQEVSTASLEMYARLGDGVAHLETLRYFAAERHTSHHLAAANMMLERRWLRLNQSNLAISAGASLTFALAMAACLFIGIGAVEARAMTIGGFVLTTVYMLQMVRPLESLGSAARDLARAAGYLRPMLDLLAEPQSQDAVGLTGCAGTGETACQRAVAVSVHDLHFAYAPDRPILTGVDFEVPAGSMTAIVGRSGSGKSSLARLLMRLYVPQQGGILLDGRPLASIDIEQLRTRLVGLVPQETALLHDTIAGNIALGAPAASRADIEHVAREAQLERLLQRLPDGLDTPVGERGMQLSGGERQRVGIARALLRRPGLYVLDEPTSSLDSKTEADILKALRSLSGSATTIVIAHRLSTIVEADEILVLDEGRIRERGKHQSLIAMNGLYARMWRQQIAGAT